MRKCWIGRFLVTRLTTENGLVSGQVVTLGSARLSGRAFRGAPVLDRRWREPAPPENVVRYALCVAFRAGMHSDAARARHQSLLRRGGDERGLPISQRVGAAGRRSETRKARRWCGSTAAGSRSARRRWRTTAAKPRAERSGLRHDRLSLGALGFMAHPELTRRVEAHARGIGASSTRSLRCDGFSATSRSSAAIRATSRSWASLRVRHGRVAAASEPARRTAFSTALSA